VECVLAEVDPDRGDGFRRLLRCAHRMLLELLRNASSRRPSRLGAGRGPAIPLAEVAYSSIISSARPSIVDGSNLRCNAGMGNLRTVGMVGTTLNITIQV
jgi:hypothetical protein